MTKITGPSSLTITSAELQSEASTGSNSHSPRSTSPRRSPALSELKPRSKPDPTTGFQAQARGYLMRTGTMSHTSPAPGITQTTIHGGPQGVRPPHTPLADIRNELGTAATYHKLTVRGGATSGMVIGTTENQPPQPPRELAEAAPAPSAFVNGGYFVHKPGLKVNDSNAGPGDLGRPVGPTGTRTDHVQIPDAWKADYGHIRHGNDQGEIAVTSGPLLALNGRQTDLGNAERFQYRVGGNDNSLNKFAGALTHASDANERAAVSVYPSRPGAPGNMALHALTTGGNRSAGATMEQWQRITNVSTDPSGSREGVQSHAGVSTLNLDGGGSVFLGVRDENGAKPIARGGGPIDDPAVRPVANIVVAKPEGSSDD